MAETLQDQGTSTPPRERDTARLIRAFDWSQTDLGPIADWPASLKTATELLLASPVPIVMLWGDDGYMIYNDAYSVFAGERHPELLGSKVREGWAEVADYNDNILKVVLGAGETISYRDRLLMLDRTGSGVLEAVWVDVDYSPVFGEDGARAGVIAIVAETTDRVLAERRAADEQERQRQLLQQTPGFMAVLNGPEHRFDYVNDAYVEIAGGRPLLGLTVREAFPELEGQGFNEEIDRVFTTGQRFRAVAAPVSLGDRGERRFVDLLYEPIRDDAGVVTGVFVGGYDVTEAQAAMEALSFSEARLRFLDQLQTEADRATDANQILAVITRMTAEQLGASICAYADMDEDQDGFTIRGDWAAPGAASIVGRYRLADFGATAVAELTAGRPLIVRDSLAELPPAEAAAFQAIGISATLCMPLVKSGRLTALMAVHFRAPHDWTDDELATLREVTERSWAHIERSAADAELRATAEALRELNATLEQRVEQRTRELRDSEDFARLTLAAVGGVGVWTYSIVQDRFYFDANIAQLYGLAEADGPLGVSRDVFLHNIHPDDRSSVAGTMAQGLQRSGDVELEYRIAHPDGSIRWVLSRGHTYFENGQAVRRTGVGVDMTKQRTLEEQFRQSQKMEAVGQLTGGLAHDFNNLLAGISGSLEMLQTRIAQGRFDAVDRYMNAAQGASKRAAALTHRLLAFSRRQTLDPKPTDVNRLIYDMEELIRRTVGPHIKIEVVGAAGLWVTLIDPNQLENALLNLCLNARDAMPDGGRITIETANKWLDERAAGERDLPPGQYVSLCVTDTGSGMTPEVMARAFDPFFTTKPLGAGTGLGLSMTYGFVRQSGGQVRIYSELGQGTTMCLYLPRDHSALEASVIVPHVGDAVQGDGEVVLVVDDEPTIRMLVSEVLEDCGYAGIEASDGPTGLQILQSNARVDLLITDVGLPGGINGRQIADAARALRPELKVLFITGYAENAILGSGQLGPGLEVLTKPFSMAALSQRIRRLIES